MHKRVEGMQASSTIALHGVLTCHIRQLIGTTEQRWLDNIFSVMQGNAALNGDKGANGDPVSWRVQLSSSSVGWYFSLYTNSQRMGDQQPSYGPSYPPPPPWVTSVLFGPQKSVLKVTHMFIYVSKQVLQVGSWWVTEKHSLERQQQCCVGECWGCTATRSCVLSHSGCTVFQCWCIHSNSLCWFVNVRQQHKLSTRKCFFPL